ncbi:hypothetical protein OH807_04495 [Kitasatospora sp. NBC_01560]|uniref:hypothetical protein n=1 Tax=Kitasatospora sp. NBC_01560 TaxID=2975965 RepID=UPI00386D00BE
MLDRESALRLAGACAHESEIRERLRGSALGAEMPLDAVLAQARDDRELPDLLAQARDDRELPDLLEALHRTLRATGDRRGLDAYTGADDRNARGLFTAGVDHAVPTEPLLLCPLQLCLRHERPDASAGAPRCAANGDLLLRRED